MHAISLLLALLFAVPVSECETKLAIALALAEADEPAQTSVVKETKTDKPKQQSYKEVRVTKYRTETRCSRDRWGRKSCHKVRVPYTVIERVPIATKTGGYPTGNTKIYRLNGGKGPHVDWKHLTQGDHAGKFDPSWLRTLSQAELEALHSDHHDELKYGTKKVHWNYVVRPQ